MNILYITYKIPIPAHFNGCTLINYHILKYLALQHKVHLVAFETQGTEVAKEDIDSLCSNLTLVKNDEKFIIKNNNKYSYLTRKFPDMAYEESVNMNETIQGLIKTNEYDIIYTDKPNLARYTVAIKSTAKLISPHDSMSLLLSTYQGNTVNFKEKLLLGIEKLKMKRFEKSLYKQYDKCIFVSQKDINFIKLFYPKLRGTVIPNGVDAGYFCPNKGIEKDPERIVFSGVMDYKPNVDAMLYFTQKILPIVRMSCPGVKLYIVGKNPTAEIRELSQLKNVFVTGYVEDIRDYLWKSSIYISPLLCGAGIKNKILEAMALGMPIIATSLSCDGIDVKDGTNVFIRNNEQEFACGVIALLKDNEVRNHLSINARNKVLERYSWENCAKSYEKTMLDLINIVKIL